ncbi:DUF4116 domain-containing protein [Streptobacillus moniliformis]|nr:DUF4116 domain-containing protein [Streptobacillus moniliformis]
MNWNNKEVVLEAVKNRGWALEFASERLRNNEINKTKGEKCLKIKKK